MKKTLAFLAVMSLFASSQAFATYIVVLKDGTRYRAVAKWTVSNGKALVKLENGGSVQLNPAEIDVAKSDQLAKLGLGDVNVLAVEDTAAQQAAPKSQQPSLNSMVRRRATPTPTQPAPSSKSSPPTAPATVAPLPDQIDGRVKENFERAFENVGIFEHKLTGTTVHIRAELTADSEDKVFNALSATAFLIARNAGVDSAKIDMVEIFIKQTNGGAAGRFQMNRADAETLNNKSVTREDYFVRKVIY